MDDSHDDIKLHDIQMDEDRTRWEIIEEYIEHYLNPFFGFYRKIKWFYQRHTRGWDDTELWGIDYCFAEWVVPRLRGFRNLYNPPRDGYGVGIPTDIYEEYDEDGEKATKVWCSYLDEMILGFETKIKENYGDVYGYEQDRKLIERAMELYSKYWESLWD